jgi:hypothetical protein
MQRFDSKSTANDAGLMKTAIHIVLLLAVTLAASVTLASTPEQEKHAQGLVAEAKTHMQAGEYEQAAKIYMQAYGLAQRPAIVFNAARAYEQAGLWQEAKPLFELYLQIDSGSDLDSVTGRADAQKRLDAVNARIAADRAQKAAPPVKIADPAPLPPPVVVTPPPTLPPPVQSPVVRQPPRIQDPPVVQPPRNEPALGTTAPVDESWSGMKTAGVVTLTTGGVLVVVSIIVAIVAQSDRSSLEARLQSDQIGNSQGLTLHGAVTQVELDNGIATYNARQVTAGVLGGIGAAAVVVGSVMWWQDSQRSNGRMADVDGPRIMTGIMPNQGGATLTLAGHF